MAAISIIVFTNETPLMVVGEKVLNDYLPSLFFFAGSTPHIMRWIKLLKGV